MPENIMKTLWDESDDLHDETMSTNSVLSDDYTSNDIQDLQETIENENIEDGIESDSIESILGPRREDLSLGIFFV